MKNISVVIGAGYGDEGKGLMTDFLTGRLENAVFAVVRFNGGAQAGHGVELPSGFRHVFHTLGSGTLNGATTILSRDFIVNPVLFWLEVHELTENLQTAGTFTQFTLPYIDPRCKITTPYEMELNQAVERMRGNERHGSCGVGVGETVERESRGYSLTVQDVINGDLIDRLTQIESEYVPERMVELGIDEYEAIDTYTLANFVKDTEDMIRHAIIEYDYKAVNHYDHIVFEGAQGLCLDEYSKDFPHVTRSRTGLKNVISILYDSNFDGQVEVYYATRAYTTRHGAGPLNGEILDRVVSVVDKTNAPNEFQGRMRYAKLDVERVGNEILNDIEQNAGRGIRVNPNLLVTHCDQLCNVTDETPEEVVNKLATKTNIDHVMTSRGPTRRDVRYWLPC